MLLRGVYTILPIMSYLEVFLYLKQNGISLHRPSMGTAININQEIMIIIKITINYFIRPKGLTLKLCSPSMHWVCD